MIEVLVAIKILEMHLKDLHYRSHGLEFYGLHLLADKFDFSEDTDKLKETFYLGHKKSVPPSELSITSIAVARMKNDDSTDNIHLLTNVSEACETLSYALCSASNEEEIPGGVQTVLDGIGEKAVTLNGLVNRSMA